MTSSTLAPTTPDAASLRRPALVRLAWLLAGAGLLAALAVASVAFGNRVLGLDELPDDDIKEHSDEPFHVERPVRAIVLREVLAAQLRDPSVDPEECYGRVVRDMELRGQFPVGVFGSAARANDLRVLAEWRE